MLKIIFGTESGNAEMAAEDMAAVLTSRYRSKGCCDG
jgi:flavodoxin